uniref:AMP-dependent synthetase/ligase domain-containing protein n=1 Tax=Branchiostoma floridae TaxID=7739 RepID=C3ZT58_BRAFL|eukprot:XP_002588253.1 hypothetical protein BRAFLDRAFT_86701 [Branchiostoma floridae]
MAWYPPTYAGTIIIDAHFKRSLLTFVFRRRRHELDSQANRLAAGLKAIGTERGDVVAWLVGHRPEWIYLYFAVAKLGAIAAGVKVLIMGDITGVNETDDTVPYLCSLFPEVKTTKPGKLQIESIGAYSMDEVQTLGSDEKLIAEVRALQHQLSCHDTFLLVFSSGVTLYPYLSTPYYVICPMFAPGCAVAVPASTAPSSMEITKTIQEERDVGTLDEHGVLKLYGRASEMIIRNAYNVHPAVVEAPLSKHPKVQDVRMVPIELPGYFVFFDEFPVTTTLLKIGFSLSNAFSVIAARARISGLEPSSLIIAPARLPRSVPRSAVNHYY